MPLRLRDPQRLLFALFLIGLGFAGLWAGWDLPMGRAIRMGVGYLPKVLSVIVLLFGVGLACAAFADDGRPLERWSWRGLAIILGALALFGVLVEQLGLVLTIPLVALLATWAAPDRRWLEAAIFALCLAAFCALVFRVLLGLPLPVFPGLMDLFANLGIGFGEALTLTNLAFCLIGVVVGTLVGVLPGIGPLATVAMLLPITFTLSPVTALIMLAGIYYGAQYGGSTTAILVALPGEASAVVTVLDGHQMARKGRGGAALAIAAIGSFVAGTAATVLIATVAEPMTELALQFGPAEYFSLMVFGLIGAVVLASGSIVNALAMIFVGLLLGMVGIDVNSGLPRYTFGIPNLSEGINFVTIALGLFGIGDIIYNLERGTDRSIVSSKIGSLWLTREETRRSVGPVLRGTLIGSVLGVLPGGGAVLSAFSSYAAEKKLSRTPERFGQGMIEGVAGPESANNAGSQTSFIPMLTLGIPSNALMALMIGALIMHGIQPGPQVLTSQPALFWGLIASMWIGNLMLLVINLPLIGIWVALLRVPYRLLCVAILVFSAIGVYSINNAVFDVFMTAGFGLLGYFFLKVGAEPAPLLLGFVLGPMMEENLRRAMLISRGDPTVFVERPISLGLLLAALALLAIVLLPRMRRAREQAFREA